MVIRSILHRMPFSVTVFNMVIQSSRVPCRIDNSQDYNAELVVFDGCIKPEGFREESAEKSCPVVFGSE